MSSQAISRKTNTKPLDVYTIIKKVVEQLKNTKINIQTYQFLIDSTSKDPNITPEQKQQTITYQEQLLNNARLTARKFLTQLENNIKRLKQSNDPEHVANASMYEMILDAYRPLSQPTGTSAPMAQASSASSSAAAPANEEDENDTLAWKSIYPDSDMDVVDLPDIYTDDKELDAALQKVLKKDLMKIDAVQKRKRQGADSDSDSSDSDSDSDSDSGSDSDLEDYKELKENIYAEEQVRKFLKSTKLFNKPKGKSDQEFEMNDNDKSMSEEDREWFLKEKESRKQLYEYWDLNAELLDPIEDEALLKLANASTSPGR